MNPQAQIVAGFTGIMPTFQEQVSEDQLLQLLAFIKSLHVEPAATSAGNESGEHSGSTEGDASAEREVAGRSLCKRRIRNTNTIEGELHQRAVWTQVLAADEGSQAHCLVVSRVGHRLFLLWRNLRDDDSHRTLNAARRLPFFSNLQQGLHATRNPDDLFLPDSGDTCNARQFSYADDDRRERSRVPTHKFTQLVYLHSRRNHHHLGAALRRRRYRLDFLRAIQHDLFEYLCCSNRPRHFHKRLLLNSDRTQLHRHDSRTMRAPGMTWFRLPLFIWSHYATSLIMILGTPVVAITILLLAFERLARIGIFDPAIGGDPVLFQHLFWFYSHPAVYIMILPSIRSDQ